MTFRRQSVTGRMRIRIPRRFRLRFRRPLRGRFRRQRALADFSFAGSPSRVKQRAALTGMVAVNISPPTGGAALL